MSTALFAVYAVGAVLFFGAFGFAGKNPERVGAPRRPWTGYEACGLFLLALTWPAVIVAVCLDVSIPKKTP